MTWKPAVLSDSPDISIIIVSFNTCEITVRCLEALYSELGSPIAEVIVVDNASTDGSLAAIRERFPQAITVANTVNVGFGAANNQAMRMARGKLFLLLNSDAFIQSGAVREMARYLNENASVGAVGPRVLNGDLSLQRSCYRFPTPARAWAENLWISGAFGPDYAVGDYRRWPHDRERIVDWVIGACVMVRREVYEQVGGFDEKFFMYAEETDWQKRIRRAGWQVAFVPTASVVHLGGASGASQRTLINKHFFDSLDYYELKHHGVLGLILLRMAMIVGAFPRLAAYSAAVVLLPAKRQLARGKVRLLSWLIFRQMTHWRCCSPG